MLTTRRQNLLLLIMVGVIIYTLSWSGLSIYATSWTAPSASVSTVTAPPPFEPLKQRWFLKYLEIHKREHAKIQRGEKPRLAVFRFVDGGWGNRMRSQYFVFMLAIFTERMFVTDHDDMLFHFGDPHPEMPIFWKNLQVQGLSKMELSHTRLSFDGFCNDLDSVKHLSPDKARAAYNDKYREDVLEFMEATTPEVCFFKKDTGLVDYLVETFETKSRFSISGQLTSVLLANPAPVLKDAASSLKKDMKWDTFKRVIVIQLRAFIDYWSAHEIIREQLPRFWNYVFDTIEANLTSDIAPLRTDRKKIAIWFTTDESTLQAEVTKMIGDRGYTAILSPFEPTHTSLAPAGLKHAIVEWFLLAETYATFTLGTTYAQFGLARTYWTSQFYQFQCWPPQIAEWFGRMPYEHAAVPAWGQYCGQDICY